MKKTLTINISGNIFHIDEDAYETLYKYINKLKTHYKDTDEGLEIIHDIEARIAEIFIENLSVKTEVVDSILVEKLIGILGKPEEIFDDEFDSENQTTDKNEENKEARQRKSLYRDPNHKVLAGVASGLSAYLGINVIIIRLLFLITFFLGYGSPFIIYVILWIMTPKALTASQRLEMQGKKINIKNIDKHIKDEYNYIKDELSNFNKSKTIGSKIEKIVTILEPALKLALKVGIVILGAWLIIMGIVSFIGLMGSIFFTTNFINFDMNSNLINLFIDSGNITFFSLAAGISILIPIIMLIFIGVKLIFRFKSNNKIILISSMSLWFVSLACMAFVGLSQVSEFRAKASQTSQTECLGLTNYNSINITAIDNSRIVDFDDDLIFNGYNIIHTENEELIAGISRLNILKSDDDKVSLRIKKSSRGKNYDSAKENSNNINYRWNETDSIMTLNNYYIIPKESMWRKQNLDITLLIPEGQIVYLDNSLQKIITEIKNTNNTWGLDMLGKKWIMRADGLTEY